MNIFLFLLLAIHSWASSPFENLNAYKQNLGFVPLYEQTPLRRVRVAILSGGFSGYEAEIGKSLPRDTHIMGPVQGSLIQKRSPIQNGLSMAQMLIAMTTDDLQLEKHTPELFLYPTESVTNLEMLITSILENQIQLVLALDLHLQEVEPALMDRALKAGLIWIRNAGDEPKNLLPWPKEIEGILSVGAVDSASSFVSRRTNKPDILAPSLLIWKGSGRTEKGSRAAATLVTAGATMILAQSRRAPSSFELSKKIVLYYDWSQRGLSLNLLGFSPTGPSCFWRIPPYQVPNLPEHVGLTLQHDGAHLVETSAGVRLMVPYDPVFLVAGVGRHQLHDMITIGPEGFRIRARYGYIPPNEVEVFQTPIGAPLCDWPGIFQSRFFSLRFAQTNKNQVLQ